MRWCAWTLEGEMTSEEHRLLVDLLRRSERRGTHLEIGTGAGGTPVHHAQRFRQRKSPSLCRG